MPEISKIFVCETKCYIIPRLITYCKSENQKYSGLRCNRRGWDYSPIAWVEAKDGLVINPNYSAITNPSSSLVVDKYFSLNDAWKCDL